MGIRHPCETGRRWVQTGTRLLAPSALLALILVSAWALAACGEEATPAGELAPDDIVATLEEWFAAETSGDKAALAAVYAEDAVIDDFLQDPPVKTEGRDAVVDMVSYWSGEGLKLASAGKPLRFGDFVVQPVRYDHPDGTQGGQGVHTFTFDENGLITHEWATGSFNEE